MMLRLLAIGQQLERMVPVQAACGVKVSFFNGGTVSFRIVGFFSVLRSLVEISDERTDTLMIHDSFVTVFVTAHGKRKHMWHVEGLSKATPWGLGPVAFAIMKSHFSVTSQVQHDRY